MKKLITTAGVLVLSLGLLTGCAEKTAVKLKDDTKKNIQVTTTEDNKDKTKETDVQQDTNTNNNTTEQTSQQNKQISTKSKTTKNKIGTHNFHEASKLLDLMTYSMANIETGNSTVDRFVQYTGGATGPDGVIKNFSMAKVVDTLNAFNNNTYNDTDVLAFLRNSKEYNFVEVNGTFKQYNQKQRQSLVGEQKTIVYFKGDHSFAIRVRSGIGGASDSMFSPQENWKVSGDKIIINYVNVVTGKKTGVLTLRLNNKQYTGGTNRSMYYIESMVYL